MRKVLHIMYYEWLSLWRSNTIKVLLVVIIGAGLYGIYFGKFEIQKQNNRISEVEQNEKENFDSLLVWAQLDTSVVDNKKKYEQAVSPTGVGWSKHFYMQFLMNQDQHLDFVWVKEIYFRHIIK